MKVVRSRAYVFEGELPEEVVALLEKWGQLVKRGEVAVYSMDSGEVRVKKVADSPTKVVRRLYISPGCGCLVELDEERDFEEGKVRYSLAKKRLCPAHQT